MRRRILVALCTAALVGVAGIAQARPGGWHGHSGGHWHGGGHGHFGHHSHFSSGLFIFATPLLFAPRYVAPAPAYYEPPVYIEQPQVQPDAQAYWYYCPQSRAYYPYVQTCPGPWQRVAPQPPPG
jgi:hypothetical protein